MPGLLLGRIDGVALIIARVAVVVDVPIGVFAGEDRIRDRSERRVGVSFLHQGDAFEAHEAGRRKVEQRPIRLSDLGLDQRRVLVVGAGPPVVRVEGVEVELHVLLHELSLSELHVPLGDDDLGSGPDAVAGPGGGEGVGHETLGVDRADAHGVGSIGLDLDLVTDLSGLLVVDHDVAAVGEAHE